MKKWLRTALVIVLIICTLPISAFAAVENDDQTAKTSQEINVSQSVTSTRENTCKAKANQTEVKTDSDTALNAKLVTSMDVGDNSIYEAENNNSFSNADVIYSDYTVSGSLTVNDIDYYQFTLTQTSTISLVAISSVSTSMAVLLDCNDEVIDAVYFDDYDSESATYSGVFTYTLESGTYYWAFFDTEDYTSNYRFYFLIEPEEQYDLKLGWNDIGGEWIYVTEINASAGTYKHAIGWWKLGGVWYYFENENGYMATGWWVIDDEEYYFNADGAMQTGWLKWDGVWFYLKSSGAMASGWSKIGGKWYFFNVTDSDYYTGEMCTGWWTIDGVEYYFNTSGAMKTGWLKWGGVWYYFKSSGAMATGWQKIGGKWYGFDDSGVMLTGWITDSSSRWYYCNSSGVMQTGWLKSGGKWYYLIPNSGSNYGAAAGGWWKISGVWYYFDNTNGDMYTGNHYIGGRLYRFSSSGACLNP